MNIITVREKKRGCGFRKPGGLYFRTDSLGTPCGALPIELSVCPTCHAGIKQSRGWTWINLAAIMGDKRGCASEFCGSCPMGQLKTEKAGLLWIGEKFYRNTYEFAAEARSMGLSRRISAIPRGFKLGETWICLAHKTAIQSLPDPKPGIFHVFKPQRIEYVVRPKDKKDFLESLERRGITLVRVIKVGPDGQEIRQGSPSQPAT